MKTEFLILSSHSGRKAEPRMARTKLVFKTSELPHLWAHQTQISARNAQGNLYFENGVIYSYGSHFPIAAHVKAGKRSAVLFTTRSYSVTTAKHIQIVRHAIPQNVTVFHVEHVTNSPLGSLPSYLERINALAVSANSRKMETTRMRDVSIAERTIKECREFCKFFKLKIPKFPKLPAIDLEKHKRQAGAVEDRRDKVQEARKIASLKSVAAYEKRREEWEASGECQHTPRHDYSTMRYCKELLDREEWEANREQIIERWKNGDTSAVLRDSYSLPVMLRIKGDEVQTSHGAIVPALHALRALRIARHVVERQEAFVTNGHTIHVGHYKIDRIDIDGTVTAGCHVIPYSEVQRIGPDLERLFQDTIHA